MEATAETREQSLAQIEFFLGLFSDKELRLVTAFMRGIWRARK